MKISYLELHQIKVKCFIGIALRVLQSCIETCRNSIILTTATRLFTFTSKHEAQQSVTFIPHATKHITKYCPPRLIVFPYSNITREKPEAREMLKCLFSPFQMLYHEIVLSRESFTKIITITRSAKSLTSASASKAN